MDKWDMTFVIDHVPHPYTRTTRRQQWVDERWRRYVNSRDHLRADVSVQMRQYGWRPYTTGEHLSISVKVLTGRENYNDVDADNILKGILDGLQGVAFPNDAWVDELYLIRCKSPDSAGMAIVKIKKVSKEAMVLKALGITKATVREHGLVPAIQKAIEGLRKGDDEKD